MDVRVLRAFRVDAGAAQATHGFNLRTACREIRPTLHIISLGIQTSAQKRLVHTHDDECVFLIRSDTDDIQNVGGEPGVNRGAHNRIQRVIQNPEIVLGGDKILTAHFTDHVNGFINAIDGSCLHRL